MCHQTSGPLDDNTGGAEDPMDKPTRRSEHPLASGGFGGAWEGTYNCKCVVIKVLRVHKGDDVRRVKNPIRPTFLLP